MKPGDLIDAFLEHYYVLKYKNGESYLALLTAFKIKTEVDIFNASKFSEEQVLDYIKEDPEFEIQEVTNQVNLYKYSQ